MSYFVSKRMIAGSRGIMKAVLLCRLPVKKFDSWHRYLQNNGVIWFNALKI